MSENSYSSENSNTWAVRYTKKELQWDDIKRIGKEIIPVVLLLFFVAMYLVMFLYTQMALKEGISDSQKKIILLKAFIIPLISTGMLFNILSNQSQKLIKRMHKLPDEYEMSALFKRKLYGIPPFPKPFEKLARYPFITFREPEDLDGEHWARWFGGPATLVIYDGLAVYIERGNQFSRVLGPGLPMPVLERYETIKAIVDLRPQVREMLAKTWTKDGVEIEFKVRAEIQVKSSDESKKKSVKTIGNEKNKNLIYPFDPNTVKTIVERTAVRLDDKTKKLLESTWDRAAMGTITGTIKKYIAAHSIDELFFENENSPKFLSFDISEGLSNNIKIGLDAGGSHLISLQIADVTPVDSEILETLKIYWQVQKEKYKIIKEGEYTAESIRVKQRVETRAYQEFLHTLIDSLSEINEEVEGIDPERFAETSLLLLAQTLEKSMGDPVLAPIIAKESLKALAMLKRQLNM